MLMPLIYTTLFACTQMENPGDPFAPVEIADKKKAPAVEETSSTAVEVGSGATTNKSQTYEFVCSVVNNNVVRISGGALGFPIL